jgi:hypothetical protein
LHYKPLRSTLVALVIPTLFVTAVRNHSNPNAVHAATPGIVASWLLEVTPHGAAKRVVLQTSTADVITASVNRTPLTNRRAKTSGSGTSASVEVHHFKRVIVYVLTAPDSRFTGSFTAYANGTVNGNNMTGSATVTLSDKKGRIIGQETSAFTGISTASNAP